MRGLFITLEGIDGCGKSTQQNLLAQALNKHGYDVVPTREPGGTPLGEGIRLLLVSAASDYIAATTELLLYVAARAQHVSELIKPSLEAGRIVISDRYTDSTVAFQGYGRRLDLQWIEKLNSFATEDLVPDLTIVLDLDPTVARARLGPQPIGGLLGSFDRQHRDFHAAMREGFLKMARTEPSRIRVLDASGTLEETHAKVMALVLPLIKTE